MNKEFIPYEQAVALKELGFNEPCFATYFNKEAWRIDCVESTLNLKNNQPSNTTILAPLYQQVFRWFSETDRIKWPIESWIKPVLSKGPRKFGAYYWQRGEEHYIGAFNKRNEAELFLLKTLIEIVRNKETLTADEDE